MTETATTVCPHCHRPLVTEGLNRGTLLICAGCQGRFRLTSGAVPLVPRDNAEPGDGDVVLPFVLPVGRSGWAIAAGYLGLLSLIPLVGLVALITGWLAVRDLNRHPKQRGWGRTIFGLVMGALSTLAWAVALVFLLRR